MNRDLLKYNKWDTTEPDGDQHCVIYQTDTGGTFADKACSDSKDYLCSTEGKVVPSCYNIV